MANNRLCDGIPVVRGGRWYRFRAFARMDHLSVAEKCRPVPGRGAADLGCCDGRLRAGKPSACFGAAGDGGLRADGRKRRTSSCDVGHDAQIRRHVLGTYRRNTQRRALRVDSPGGPADRFFGAPAAMVCVGRDGHAGCEMADGGGPCGRWARVSACRRVRPESSPGAVCVAAFLSRWRCRCRRRPARPWRAPPYLA